MLTTLKIKWLFWELLFSILLILAINIVYVLSAGSMALFLVLSIVIFLLVVSLIYILLNRSVLSKIAQIKTVSSSVASLNLSQDLQIQTGDELESIAQNINKIILNLHNQAQKFTSDTHTLGLEKQKFQEILEGISDSVLAVDQERKIVLCNLKIAGLLGLERAEIEGKKISEVMGVSNKEGDIADLLYCPISLDGKKAVPFSQKAVKITTAKKISYADLISNPVDSPSGINIACVLTLRDVTGGKEVDDMKTDFVSMAAHELRTPLTTLKGYISVFAPEVEKILNPDQKMLLQNITKSSDQLMALVENLLNVSRIDRGVITLSMERVDWPKLVESTVNDFMDRAKEKQIELKFTAPNKTIPPTSVDKSKIIEVLSNLITNAIKYTDPQGRISVTIEVNGQEVITHVSDSGHGISKDLLPYLFSKFFRVQGKLEYATKGTGLGLYITKSLIDLHHGKIWVESEIGKGSTFSFSLPL